MEKKFNGNRFSAFMKKNGYVLLMIVCLAAIVTMIAYTVMKSERMSGNGLNNEPQAVPVVSDGKDNNDDKQNEKEQNSEVERTDVIIQPSFIAAPIDNAEVLKGYSENALVYNATMKHWATHQAIDFKAEAGAPVKAVMDGEVTSVSTSTLKGTTVVVKHADGLESTYSLLGQDVRVKAGDKVKKGDVLGYVAESGVFETADGAHLHFELRKDGKLVDPDLYAESADK